MPLLCSVDVTYPTNRRLALRPLIFAERPSKLLRLPTSGTSGNPDWLIAPISTCWRLRDSCCAVNITLGTGRKHADTNRPDVRERRNKPQCSAALAVCSVAQGYLVMLRVVSRISPASAPTTEAKSSLPQHCPKCNPGRWGSLLERSSSVEFDSKWNVRCRISLSNAPCILLVGHRHPCPQDRANVQDPRSSVHYGLGRNPPWAGTLPQWNPFCLHTTTQTDGGAMGRGRDACRGFVLVFQSLAHTQHACFAHIPHLARCKLGAPNPASRMPLGRQVQVVTREGHEFGLSSLLMWTTTTAKL